MAPPVCQENWQRYGAKTACDLKAPESGSMPKPASLLDYNQVPLKAGGQTDVP